MDDTDTPEHETKLLRDVVVSGTTADLAQVWASLDVGGGHWTRDAEAERWHADQHAAPADEVRVFLYRSGVLPAASLWLFREESHLHVGNIVPKDVGSLEARAYNSLAEDFVRTVLHPRLLNGMRTDLGPTSLRIEDVLSPAALRALRSFSACANKRTGNAHPYDNERWRQFVRLAHGEASELEAKFLDQWLISDEWGEDWAERLSSVYDAQRDILSERPTDFLEVGTDREWAETVSRLRNVQAVVVIDACSILDVLRLTYRFDRVGDPAKVVEAVRLLLGRARQAVPEMALVLPSVTRTEIDRNRTTVYKEALRQLEQAHRLLKNAAELRGATDEDAGSFETVTIEMDALLDELLAHSTSLPITPGIRDRAFERSSKRIAPASPSKDSLMDCALAEVAMHLASMRTSSTAPKFFLLSSNTKDFEHASLERELEAVGVHCCRDWRELQSKMMR